MRFPEARARHGPGLQPEARLRSESFVAGGVADQDGGGHWPAALLGQQFGAVSADQLGQLCRELIDLRVESAQLRDMLTRDPHTRAGGAACAAAGYAVKHPRLVQRAAFQGALQLGVQLEQMPPQPVHGPGPVGDEIVAVIEQQPDLHRLLVQVCDRETARHRR